MDNRKSKAMMISIRLTFYDLFIIFLNKEFLSYDLSYINSFYKKNYLFLKKCFMFANPKGCIS